MTRRKRRKLVRRAKEAAVLGAMLYLAAGITVTGKNEESENKVIYARDIEEVSPEILHEEQKETEEPEVAVVPHMNRQKYDLDSHEAYLLAKIAMAEAESEDTQCKALVMLVVLNRVQNEKFPNSVEAVIYEDKQFTPILDGRFDRVEPNQDCWGALDLVQSGWNESEGALYFELTTDEETWHNTHLEKLFDHGTTTFYAEKKVTR